MNDTNAKQQIVDKIKKSNNILVAVSNDPSVDELSAALGLTVLLNKMNKHATAVFSGAIPPAINFLEPDKTFENTVDSLRDFIIALDKEKADHLRYKVEGDVVKIFITPYRTTITSDDLDFSQGDYNVELVLALGVQNKEHLDNALMAHGRILHDATVATISAGNETSDLGSITWAESGASSLSEMLVSLTDAMKGDKALLDEQVATAFLTGLVAATDRFSNNRTSSKVMTIAAQLMAAGANQQLIALKLQEANTISGDAPADTSNDSTNSDGTTDLAEDTSTKLNRSGAVPFTPSQPDGELNISHQLDGNLDEVAKATAALQQQAAADAAEEELAKRTGGKRRRGERKTNTTPDEQELADGLAQTTAASPSVADMQQDLAKASEELEVAQPVDGEPSLGGTLNATTEQAADDKRRALEHDQNHTILSHDKGEYIGGQTPTFQAPINAANDEVEEPSVPDIFSQSPNEPSAPTIHAAPVEPPAAPAPASTPAPAPEPPVVSGPTLAELDAQHRSAAPEPPEAHTEARAAVEAAFGAVPYEPAPIPLPSNNPAPAPTPEVPGPVPVMPPLPDFSTLPPLPPSAPQPPVFGSPAPEPPQQLPPQPPADPGQFRIPGQ